VEPVGPFERLPNAPGPDFPARHSSAPITHRFETADEENGPWSTMGRISTFFSRPAEALGSGRRNVIGQDGNS
jgi:hypothetical protein